MTKKTLPAILNRNAKLADGTNPGISPLDAPDYCLEAEEEPTIENNYLQIWVMGPEEEQEGPQELQISPLDESGPYPIDLPFL